MKEAILKISFTGLLVVSLSGCFGPSRDEVNVCLSPFEDQIKVLENKRSFSKIEMQLIKDGFNYVINNEIEDGFQKLYNSTLAKGYDDNFINRLSDSLGEANQISKIRNDAKVECLLGTSSTEVEIRKENSNLLNKNSEFALGVSGILSVYFTDKKTTKNASNSYHISSLKKTNDKIRYSFGMFVQESAYKYPTFEKSIAKERLNNI